MAKPRKKPETTALAKATAPAPVPAPPIGYERKRNLENKRWYADQRKPHEAVFAIANTLARSGRRDEMRLWNALFLDQPARASEALRQGYYRPGMRARFNIIRNAVEVLKARVGRTLPRPWIVTVGGDWKLQRKSKAFQRYIEGDFERLKANRMRRRALLDALVFGKGAIKVHEDRGRVAWSRVWAGNILKHPREEAVGGTAVRTMYEIAFVDRDVLASEFPEDRDKIHRLNSPGRDLLRYDGSDDFDDLVLVVEGWHLPHAQDDNGEWVGGRHTIITELCTHEDATWERETFSIKELFATIDPMCERGVGYPERMCGQQSEQNSLSEIASDIARKMTPKYVTTKSSKITVEQLSNEIEIWECDGEAAPTMLQAEDTLTGAMMAAKLQRQEAYAIEGIAAESAEGSSPDNLDSGKAKLVHRDIEGERHVDLFENFEEFTVDLTNEHIATSEELAAIPGGAEKLVAYHGKNILLELKYTDVSLKDDPYHVRASPVSKLSGSPEAIFAQLKEMVQAGWISMERAQQIYDFPDMEAGNDLDYAGNELARMLIDKAIDMGEPKDGEPGVAATRACNLDYMVLEGWKQHALCQLQGATEDDLVALRDLLGHAQTLIDQRDAEIAQKAAAMAPPPPPMPPAAALPPAPTAGPVPLQVVP